MLQGINKIGRSWLGKAIVAVLFGFLIVSFAIWGIGDIFRGSVRTTVATVGKTDISAEAFRTAYQNELQRLMRQTRQSITPERARSLGLDTQILSRLVTEAALDQRAQELGLSVSDQLIARTIAQDPNFRGPNGQFDRAAFDESCARTASAKPRSSASSAASSRACNSPTPSRARFPCRSPCARRSTATAPSAARRLTSCCRRRLRATSRLRPRSS